MWLGHTRRHRSEKLRVVVRGGAVPLERLKYFGALVDVRRVYTIYACCCYININIVAHYLVVFVCRIQCKINTIIVSDPVYGRYLSVPFFARDWQWFILMWQSVGLRLATPHLASRHKNDGSCRAEQGDTQFQMTVFHVHEKHVAWPPAWCEDQLLPAGKTTTRRICTFALKARAALLPLSGFYARSNDRMGRINDFDHLWCEGL